MNEELEVKDKEWFKGLINEEGIVMDMNLLGRIDEQYWKNENIKINKGRLFYLIDQLDKREVLSSDWIAGKKMWTRNKIPFHMDVDYAVPVNDLQNLLVPKQGLPVIPKFVADWIEEEGGHYKPSFLALGYDLYSNNITYPEVDKWIADNQELFARAWLDGYTVEEEQKYIVSDNSSIPLLIKNDSGEIMSYDSQIAYNNSNGTIELTEQEIKGYDKRYMAFAKPAVVCN